MNIEETNISGCYLISPQVFGDHRGFFLEVYQQQRFAGYQLPQSFVQDNCSRSQQGILRGLHYQIQQPQGKLVMAMRGQVFDVAVDLRDDSPTFRQVFTTTLSDENHQQVYIPPGCAHGFYVVSDFADILYKCTDYYAPEFERTLLWNDPTLKIEWPLLGEPILSNKDQLGLPFSESETYPSNSVN